MKFTGLFMIGCKRKIYMLNTFYENYTPSWQHEANNVIVNYLNTVETCFNVELTATPLRNKYSVSSAIC